MARPQFSKLLVDRRRDLGLSLEQAARVLKMKEQVLVAFETGDWERIPRSGYAQGMLSSYARYLGLNPRTVIDQFKQDLFAYSNKPQQETASERAHRDRAGYADRYMGHNRRIDSSGDIDLYGSAGPAGSITSSGTFDDEMLRRLETERTGHRSVGYSERYVEGVERDGRRAQGRNRARHRPYTNRMPGREGASRSRARTRGERSSQAALRAEQPTRSTIQTRAVNAALYRDDLRYERAKPYEAASSEKGRVSSRHIASTDRPNVRRQGAPGERPRGGAAADRRRRNAQRPQSTLPIDQRTLLIVIAVLFAMIMVGVLFTVSSCVSNISSTDKPQVPVASAPNEVSSEAGDGEQPEGEAQGEGDAARTASRTPVAANAQTAPETVTVSVAEGKVSWVEVVMGDASLVAQTVSGPWEQTFSVTAPMEIQALDASAVTVTADGEPLSFESKASGVGVIEIAGPQADGEAGRSDDAEGRKGDGASTREGTADDEGSY